MTLYRAGWQTAALQPIRTWAAIQDRHRAGDSSEALAEDYGVPLGWIRHVLAPENDFEARYGGTEGKEP